LPVAERDRPAGSLIEAFERFSEVAEERVAPHLAVSDDVQTGVLLQPDRLVDGAILDLFVRGRREFAALELGLRFAQIRGTQKAADRVAAWIHREDGFTTL
jgi:hypothetical protein